MHRASTLWVAAALLLGAGIAAEAITPTPEPSPRLVAPSLEWGDLDRSSAVRVSRSERTTTTIAPTTTTTSQKVRSAKPRTPVTTAQGREVPTAPVGDVWAALARCESGMRNLDTGNGYLGYFQFLQSTWRGMGMPGRVTDHSYEVQRDAAQRLVARSGWGQFPGCARKLGLR